jgi:Glutathione S-transferase, C-terminal domain
MVPEALDGLTPEERHRVYKMMRLKVTIYADGLAEVTGAFDGLLDTLGAISVKKESTSRQYSHEPNIAVARAWLHVFNTEMTEERRAMLETKRELGYDALGVMEKHLEGNDYFVGERYSIAAIALYAYTHVAGEGGFHLDGYPAILAWLDRISSQPEYIPITQG